MPTPMPPMPPVRCSFVNQDGGPPLEASLNPTSLKLGRQVEWTDTGSVQQSFPVMQFTGCSHDTVSFTLFLDASEGTGTVLGTVQTMYGWTMPSTTVTRPPLLLFTWGTFVFEGVVKSIDVDFTLFDATGAPRRATVGLSLLGQAFSQGSGAATFFEQTPPTGIPQVG